MNLIVSDNIFQRKMIQRYKDTKKKFWLWTILLKFFVSFTFITTHLSVARDTRRQKFKLKWLQKKRNWVLEIKYLWWIYYFKIIDWYSFFDVLFDATILILETKVDYVKITLIVCEKWNFWWKENIKKSKVSSKYELCELFVGIGLFYF